MDHSDRRYIIGIDLGTTNSAVSYVDLSADGAKPSGIKIFPIPQLTGAGEFSRLRILPSFLYLPGEYDISENAVTIPWETADSHFVGAFARDYGIKVPARLVSSAKSWLCHANADRRSKILPWGAGEEVRKISPVQTTAAYLRHIRKAWNHTQGDNAEYYMENQMVTITVPASFDEVARDLTLEAASLAGLEKVTLLEEPLAAFYSWLIRHEANWSAHVQPGELILVCDVGGGTTDFTLITLREVEGNPRFERIAVGDHLILGGDNMDLALARRAEMQMSRKQEKISLSGDRWKSLCHQCRQAKESILDGEAQSRKITLMGKGKKLIGATLSAELRREEVEHTVLEGFFPIVEPGAGEPGDRRRGITEFGLPYEPEPAVTRHMGWFLERHREDVQKVLGRENPFPDLILFNGGSLKSAVIQERIRKAVRHWFRCADTTLPRVLENPEPDLAVALGSAYYGLVKIGQGVRVGSGSPRSYYMGVAMPGAEDGKTYAVCLVERGLDEGTHIKLKDREFEVLTNQPVSFDLCSSSFRSGDRCGDLVEIDESLTLLPPVQTMVQFGKKMDRTQIPVRIEADYTEMGTLSIWCCSAVSDHRWRLQFHLRGSDSPAQVRDEDIFDESVVKALCQKVRDAFTDTAQDRNLDTLVKDISAAIDRSKEKWPLGLIRSLADEMLDLISSRNVKSSMESRWLNLTGFCLRPGFGHGFDEHRIRKLWKIYKTGPCYPGNAQVRSEWWILWRRVAGGLNSGQQRQFIQDLSPILLSKKGAKSKISPQEHMEIWMAVANMEQLLVKDKIKWGRQLLSEIEERKGRSQYVWSLSRIGARDLLYGPVDRVIPAKEVAEWMEILLAKEWTNPKALVPALAQMGRRTGDRIRDIPQPLRERIVQRLSAYDFAGPWIRMLTEITHMEKQEQNAVFGESLPAGLVLRS